MKKTKQIVAIIGIALIVAMYLVTLISSFLITKYTKALFLASLFCTFVVPVMIYAYLLIYKLINKKDNTVHLKDARNLGNMTPTEEENK